MPLSVPKKVFSVCRLMNAIQKDLSCTPPRFLIFFKAQDMTGNDHALEAADPLELAEIKRRWEPYINQLPDYAYLCKDLLNGKM